MQRSRWRVIAWCGVGVAVWSVTGWPVAGLAVSATGLWAPWLMGSARVISDRLDRLEALEGWCRRMADMLSGGAAMGLAQAITISAGHVDEVIAEPVRRLAAELSDRSISAGAAVREFADTLDDRVADTVAAALLLALQQQSVGIARVLRLLADGVARDVRARREIEAARAESRQSIRMLLLIQAGVLAMLAVVPSFAAPYATPVGQTVMALLLASTVGAAGVDAPPRLRQPATPVPRHTSHGIAAVLGDGGSPMSPLLMLLLAGGRAHRHRHRRRRGRDQPSAPPALAAVLAALDERTPARRVER